MLPILELPSPSGAMTLSWLLAEGGPDLGRAFGRFHPIVVHFPIALAVVAVAAEWWRSVSRRQGMSALTLPLLWIAAASAFAATVTGLVEASSRSGSSDTLELHRWLGIASSAALLCLAWWAQSLAGSLAAATAESRAQLGSFRWVALVVCGAVGFTGHLGGELVHGKGHLTNYLWSSTESVEQPSDAAPAAEPVRLSAEEQFFLDKVKPIMEAHCFECHGPRKQKGGLRMDTKAWLFNGDAEEWTVLPGKADASLLVERVKLPRTDPDAMPPEGPGLTAEEIAALEKWIDDGAAYPVAPDGIS
ncbi:MAG: c-type cytochrome domain-containing protein, partial [Phycisphaerales bacterium]